MSDATQNQDRRSFLKHAALIGGAAGLFSTVPATASARLTAGGNVPSDVKEMEYVDDICRSAMRRTLERAAAGEGIALDTSRMLMTSRDDFVLVLASVRGFGFVDPAEMAHGTLTAFLYMNLPPSAVPAGFYALNVVARDGVRLGQNAVSVELLQGGALVAEGRGIAEVWSLQVPSALEPAVQLGLTLDDGAGPQAAAKRYLWIKCSNGGYICHDLDSLYPPGMEP